MPTDQPAETNAFVPVTPLTFEILLSLAEGDAHGYAIMKAVEQRTGGRPSLHPGTLYRALARLVDGGLAVEVDDDVDDDTHERRRYYRLTRLGRSVAVAEARRLESQVSAARARHLLPQGGGA